MAEAENIMAAKEKPQPRLAHAGKDLLLAWNEVCAAAPSGDRPIFAGSSGYVVRGGVTAVMGISSSGKTVLMKALAGRARELWRCGTVVLDGVRQPLADVRGDLVFEEDQLIGDLTVREALSSALDLRREGLTKEERKARIVSTVDRLGLTHVLDNVIGTVLRRGLSGGQQRRCSVGMELMQPPTVLFIDEPTSGLDATTAYSLIEFIRSLARDSNGQLGVVVALQQPNLRLLQLVDHVLLLGQGGTLFFGTLADASEHFESLGFTVPEGETPTDYYLQVTDPSTNEAPGVDFLATYHDGPVAKRHRALIDDAIADSTEKRAQLEYHATYWQQFTTLLHRNLTVARRDPTLYYLQFFLHSFYGFLVGAVFFSLDPFVIGSRINDAFNGITWLAFISTYIHVFKTHYLVVNNARFHHEHSNRAYAVVPYWSAELIATCIGTAAFLPGIAIAYFMMGLPSESFGFSFLLLYILCLAAEGSVHFVTQFFRSAAYAVVAAQCLMVILCVFTTGSLIRPDNVPEGWQWLQEVSYYYWGSLAMAVQVFDDIVYTCANDGFATFDNATMTCSAPLLGLNTPCDAGVDGSTCMVQGRTLLEAYKGIDGPGKWESFGKLVAIAIGFRLLVLVLYYMPADVMYSRVVSYFFVSKDRMRALTAHAGHRSGDSVVPMGGAADPSNTAANGNNQQRDASSAAGETPAGTAQLVWRNLSLTLGNGKVLIDNVSGVALGGRVLSLMGPSGAGKTTLLNALCGRATYARVRGTVLFNGRPMSRNDLDFVPQFDDLNDFFTVRETLTYTARFKRKVTDTESSISQRVDKLLRILGLEEQQNSRPGQLTGGQRKRVSIGVGLVAEPAILFLDEPTTGLDSSAAFAIVKYIVKVARQTGVVCIMTIHQPSGGVFARLDDLYLLEQGRLAFAGSLPAADTYFRDIGFVRPAAENPADFYLDLVNYKPIKAAEQVGHSGALKLTEDTTWSELYMQSEHVQDINKLTAVQAPSADAGEARVSELPRFFTLLRKLMIHNTRGPVYRLRVLQLVVLGLYLGTLYWQIPHDVEYLTEISGANFMNIWVVLFAVVASAPTFCVDRRQVQGDYVNGAYSLLSYGIAQFIASLPFIFGAAILFQLPLHWMVGFNDWFGAFAYAVLMSLALMLLMEGIVLSIVEGLKNPMLSTTFSMIVLGMLFLMPGFFLPVEDMPPAVGWIPYIIATTWATEGSLLNALKGQKFDTPGGGEIGGITIFTQVFKYDEDVNKWVDWVIVLAWVFFFRLLHYGLMRWTNRHFGKGQAGSADVAADTTTADGDLDEIVADGKSKESKVVITSV